MISNKINFLIKEYEKLKDEQSKRIEFRDQMIYITLGVIGGVFSFVFEKPEYISALLVLPFVSIVLGWTYLTNDEKISEIGNYCRLHLIPKLDEITKEENFSIIPSWEDFNLKVERRKERKILQFIIDLSIFCASSIFSIIAFFYLNDYDTLEQRVIGVIECVFIFYLGYQFFSYSTLIKKREETTN